MLARIVPFAVFMVFVGLDEGLHFLVSKGLLTVAPEGFLFLYLPKIVSVVAAIWYFRSAYTELRWADLSQWMPTLFSVAAGIGIFVLWIKMTWPFAVFGTLNGYDPASLQGNGLRTATIATRLLGATIVVPVMEELFWRSFIVRYIIRTEFETVPLGTFTMPSFMISAVLFGLEHNLWLAGIVAGFGYNYVLYKTKSIAHCILAHSVTNGALGIYVLQTNSWYFW